MNPVKTKLQLRALLFPLFSLVGCGKVVESDKTQVRNGVLYVVNETKPFSGTVRERETWGDRKIVQEIKVVQGYVTELKAWYKDGQLKLSCGFINLPVDKISTYWPDLFEVQQKFLDGPFEAFYENGQREIQAKFSKGVLVGKARSWDDDGNEKSELKINRIL